MESFEATTQTIGAGAGPTAVGPSILSLGGRAWKLLVRTPDSGVLVGNSAVSGPSTGYELVPDQEYTFIIRPTPGNSASAASSLNAYNNGGSSATISWLASPAE